MAPFKAFASVSVNTGQSFILGSDLDLDATRENARPQPVVTNRMAYVAMELGPEGSNALGFSTSQNKGVTWTGPHLLDGTGPDADVPSSAPTFVTDPSHDIACFVYFDRTTGDNEPFATAVRLPYVLVDGVTTPSNPVRFALLGVPSSLSAGSQFVVLLSTSGTSPALAVPGLPLLHLVPDALTYFLLGDPTFIPLTSGPLTIFGAGFSLPFPWPFGSGAPDLDAIAVIIDVSGQIIQVTDPVHIVSE
jgi:hypothetical protein